MITKADGQNPIPIAERAKSRFILPQFSPAF
jgi:hypothetical protein